MNLPFASLKRIGKYRIVNAESRWGIDLFDDLQKLADILSRRDYSDREIDLIFHTNWLRFFTKSLPSTEPA